MQGVITKATFTFNSKPTRNKPKEGDVKLVKGRRYVRRQRRVDGMYCVRGSKPVFDWVLEEAK